MGTRTKLVVAALLAACMLATIGCHRGRRRGGGGGGGSDGPGGGGWGGSDAGGRSMEDGGGSDSDSGGIVQMDSGPATECDRTRPCPSGETCEGGVCVAAPECTSSGDCASDEECVDGRCEPVATPSCPSDIVPLWSGTRCASSTATCLSECSPGDRTCPDSCIASDPNPTECDGCLQQNSIVCANENGCQEEWNCFIQCARENGCTDRTCVTTYCSSEDTAYGDCFDSAPADACGTELAACFSTT